MKNDLASDDNRHRAMLRFPGLAVAAVVFLLPNGAWAAGGDDHVGHPHHRHHLALFLGGGIETERDGEEKDKGYATGLQYELRFHQKWGVGGVVETLGGDTVREVTLAVPVSLHPSAGWRLFAGPGFEFTEKKDKALLRLGVGYEFHFTKSWSVAPEVVADFVEGGAVIWLGGVAVGYGF